MQLVDKKILKWNFDVKIPTAPKNYRYQLFVSENGRIFRYYKKFGKIKKDEFCYIHYRRELPINIRDVSQNSFVISGEGFCDIDTESLLSADSFMKAVKRYNARGTFLQDKLSAAKYFIGKLFGKRR